MQLPASQRLVDCTSSAARLALAFLHPWFHARVHDDPEDAADVLAALALAVSRWPAEWWVRDRSVEVDALVRGAVRGMVEEASEGGVMGLEVGEELKRLWEASNTEERERVERSRAGTPGLSRAPSPSPAMLLNDHHDGSSTHAVETRPTTPDPSHRVNSPLPNSLPVRPTSPSASPGLRSPTPSRRRGSISSPNFGFEHVRRPGSALSFRSELDHIPDVPGDVDSENRDARSRNSVRIGSLRARSPSPGPGGILSSMTPPGTPGSPPLMFSSASASASGLGRRRSRLSQSLETELGGSWTGSGSWSAAASAKYDGDSEGSGDGENGIGNSGAGLSRRDSGMSATGAVIGRGPRRISFADEADVKLLRAGSSGSGGERSPGLGAAFNEAANEREMLSRQASIEEEEERVDEKEEEGEDVVVPMGSSHTTPQQRDDNADLAKSIADVEEPTQLESDNLSALGLTTEDVADVPAPEPTDERAVDDVPPPTPPMSGDKTEESDARLTVVSSDTKVEVDTNKEPAISYRESDRVQRTAYYSKLTTVEEGSLERSAFTWPLKFASSTSTFDVNPPRYANGYDVVPDAPYRHLRIAVHVYCDQVTACVSISATSFLMLGISMLLVYMASMPHEVSNEYY